MTGVEPMNKRLNVWFPDELTKQIAARGQMSEAMRESLSRYFYLLDYERKRIQPKFTAGELSFLADICNSTRFEAHTIGSGLLADAEDTEDGTYEKWSIDRVTLLKKLKSLSLAEQMTLVDAIERFWQAATHTTSVKPGELLQ